MWRFHTNVKETGHEKGADWFGCGGSDRRGALRESACRAALRAWHQLGLAKCREAAAKELNDETTSLDRPLDFRSGRDRNFDAGLGE